MQGGCHLPAEDQRLHFSSDHEVISLHAKSIGSPSTESSLPVLNSISGPFLDMAAVVFVTELQTRNSETASTRTASHEGIGNPQATAE